MMIVLASSAAHYRSSGWKMAAFGAAVTVLVFVAVVRNPQFRSNFVQRAVGYLLLLATVGICIGGLVELAAGAAG